MASEFIITFEGKLDDFNPNFEMFNDSDVNISVVTLSGKTAAFPITWDSIGKEEPHKYLRHVEGEDTEVVVLEFSYSGGIGRGTKIKMIGGDLDFTSPEYEGKRTVVPVRAIEGTRVLLLTEKRYPYTGEFKVNNGKMQAVISIDPMLDRAFDPTWDAGREVIGG